MTAEPRHRFRLRAALAATLLLTAVFAAADPPVAPTADEARKFIDSAESRLLDLWLKRDRAAWVQANFITDDTEQIASDANAAVLAATTELVLQAARFDHVALPADVARKLMLLKTSLSLVAPSDAKKQAELARIASSMEADYGKGKYCPTGKECLDLTAMERIMAESRDPKELLDIWRGWHAIGPALRPQYQRFAELANEGAREINFADLGALWRSGYDMTPEEFSAELDRLFEQVKPLYESLHCYVRSRLADTYGKDLVPDGKPLPAHLLGNMWGQEWGNIYDLVKPPAAAATYDLTELLRAKNVDEKEMVRYGERFFTSLGFAPLPDTFWERSLFVKPRDRDVVCHASAWDLDYKDDLRIKMCIQVNGDDFSTIHHELGHNFYQRAYKELSPLLADSANDGFHEGIGDTIALSVTPEYLVKVGLLTTAPGPEGDLGFLMQRALEKVAFLPWGLLVDRWRWEVFSGKATTANYNKAWWDLRLKYQGVAPPMARSEADFDPGAKYHVPANTPYTRYFLADILQFQFHRALCQAAGYDGQLHRCSIYGNQEAGAKLIKMLEMGKKQPWPDALEAMGAGRKMDATAILDYFAPLKTWLDEQNKGRTCGW